MRPVVPWSVKGIEPEAREAAKQAARRAGMTLGAWLNHVIMDKGTDEAATPPPDFAGFEAASTQPQAPTPQGFMQPSAYAAPQLQPQIDLSPVTEAVRDLVRRIDTNERHIDTSLEALVSRVETSEQLLASGAVTNDDGLERKMQQLTERLEHTERAKTPFGRKSEDHIAVQGLEKTMNAVVDHLETADNQNAQTFFEIREMLGELRTRVDSSDEATQRQQEQSKADAFGDTLRNLSERIAEMEQSVHAVGANADQSRRQAVEEAVQAVSTKLDSDQQRTRVEGIQKTMDTLTKRIAHSEELNTDAINKLATRVGQTDTLNTDTIKELAERVNHAETHSAHAIKAIEESFEGFMHRLDEHQIHTADIVPQVIEQLDGRLEEVVSRVTDSETRALETASSVEQALSSLAHTVSSSEHRSADMRETVQSMIAQVNERMDGIETGSRLPLSPTVAVGAGLAGMAPPPLSSAPLPPPGPMDSPIGMAMPELAEPEQSAPPLATMDVPLDAPKAEFREHQHEEIGPPLAIPDIAPPPHADLKAPLGGEMPTPSVDGPSEPPVAAPAPTSDVPPPLNEKKAARDFIAAARRAAQMSQTSGEAPASHGFGEPSARYAAFEEQEDNRGKRLTILIGGALAALVVVLALVAWLVAPSTPVSDGNEAGLVSEDLLLDDTLGDGSTLDQQDAIVPDAAIVPRTASEPGEIIPEAIPEDVDSLGAFEAPTSAPSAVVASRPAPAPLPEPRVPATEAPRSIVPNASDLPPVVAAPTTPVTRAAPSAASRNALRTAAASGNPAAQYEVGLRYAQGKGVPQDYDQAAYWFELAAKQNLAIAQYRLATLFEKGRGVTQDQEQARAWYEKAAQAGNVKAMHNLAVIYAEGKGVPQDFAKAGQWFLAAADHGLADSQYNVAVLLERGLGLDEDLPAAYKWFAIAANNGDDGASARRDAIADNLEATVLVDAKLAAQTWGPKAADPIANGNLSSLGSWSNAAISEPAAVPPASSTAVADPKIAQAQRLLRGLGYRPGPADGLMGPRTRDAIRDFQGKVGLDVNGVVDDKLLNTLEAYVR